jgi:pyruvate carboxylase
MQGYFKVEEGRKTLADQTTHRACKKYIGDMIHEARLQAHVDYYRSIKKESLNKAGARKLALTKEQYLLVCE